MAKEKKPVHRVQMTEGKRQIIQQLLQEYEITRLQKTSRTHSRISLAAPSKR